MVTYPHANTVSQSFSWSLMNLVREEGNRIHSVLPTRGYAGDGLIRARNAAVEVFLRSDAEWLWTLDTDIGFPPGSMCQLLDYSNEDYRVMSGFYKTVLETGTLYEDGSVSWKEFPLVLREVEDGRFRPYDKYAGAMEVDAVGAGCLLVHRDVFQAIGTKGWFDCIPGYGEDISFCIRARKAGYKILCDTELQLSHHKAVWLRGE